MILHRLAQVGACVGLLLVALVIHYREPPSAPPILISVISCPPVCPIAEPVVVPRFLYEFSFAPVIVPVEPVVIEPLASVVEPLAPVVQAAPPAAIVERVPKPTRRKEKFVPTKEKALAPKVPALKTQVEIYNCEQVRYYASRYSKAYLEALATAAGTSADDIAKAKKCLK